MWCSEVLPRGFGAVRWLASPYYTQQSHTATHTPPQVSTKFFFVSLLSPHFTLATPLFSIPDTLWG